MQISGLSGNSAAMALQRLLQGASGGGAQGVQSQPPPRQNVPSSGVANTGFQGAQMSGDMLSALSTQQSGPPSSSDLASSLMSALDKDGDGSLGEEEISSALNNADVSQAFSSLDGDSSGSLSLDELTSGVDSMLASHRGGPPPGGPPPGGPPPGGGGQDIASSFDTDGDGGLSLSEVNSALGDDEDASSAFASLDADGDGVLSVAELESAIQAQMREGLQAYARQASSAERAGI